MTISESPTCRDRCMRSRRQPQEVSARAVKFLLLFSPLRRAAARTPSESALARGSRRLKYRVARHHGIPQTTAGGEHARRLLCRCELHRLRDLPRLAPGELRRRCQQLLCLPPAARDAGAAPPGGAAAPLPARLTSERRQIRLASPPGL